MMDRQAQLLFLYGAPASGKSTLAAWLAKIPGIQAADLDEEIARTAGRSIPAIFQEDGEPAFRALERNTLQRLIAEKHPGLRVIALGGGTLLNPANRSLCEEAGTVVCLETPSAQELAARIQQADGARPLGDRAVERAAHYASFPNRLARTFRLNDSLVLVGRGLASPFLISFPAVFDDTVARLYPHLASHSLATIPSGEQYKTPDTVMALWEKFGHFGLGRHDCVAACGGGVSGDLTGFAAATWMRGMPWINIPTTLLAMVDASTGGKTGCDLPAGKNLVGAFHSPQLVVIDVDFLQTLPDRELRSGRAEMIKHSIIGHGTPTAEPPLPTGLPTAADIAASLAVKVDIIRQDPLETTGKRLLLNCGHTVGHAVETASHYRLSHGEAVAIGCVEEARMAEKRNLAPAGWADSLARHFQAAGLPVAIPREISWNRLVDLMKMDKKKLAGSVVFALPCGWGDVRATEIAL